MFSFISHIILVISFGGIVFLVLKKMPLLAELSLAESEEKKEKRRLSLNVSQLKEKLPQKEAKTTKFDEEDDYWEKVVK